MIIEIVAKKTPNKSGAVATISVDPIYEPEEAARPIVANGDHRMGGGFIFKGLPMGCCWISLVRGYCWVCFSGFPRECFISCYRNSSVCLRVLYSSRYTSRVKSIFGQTRAVDSLIRAVNENRQHHAWIFSGPGGVGKCTTALRFSELLLKTQLKSNLSHPDLHLIRKEDVVWSTNPALQRRKQTNIPIDLLRERIIGGKTSDGKHHDSVAFKTPVLSKEKVFIIDEAELLDDAGQNALLKTLEEPPLGTTIILVTCREDMLLPTVVSRCQTVFFSPLDDMAMQKWVEGQSFDGAPSTLSWAMRFSCGSPGLVCESMETGLPALAESLSKFLSFQKSDGYTTVATQLISFVESTVARWIKENPNTSKDAANRRAANLILLMFGMAARQLIRESYPSGVELAGVLVDIERQLSTNISIKVLLESLAARWANLCVGDAVFM